MNTLEISQEQPNHVDIPGTLIRSTPMEIKLSNEKINILKSGTFKYFLEYFEIVAEIKPAPVVIRMSPSEPNEHEGTFVYLLMSCFGKDKEIQNYLLISK